MNLTKRLMSALLAFIVALTSTLVIGPIRVEAAPIDMIYTAQEFVDMLPSKVSVGTVRGTVNGIGTSGQATSGIYSRAMYSFSNIDIKDDFSNLDEVIAGGFQDSKLPVKIDGTHEQHNGVWCSKYKNKLYAAVDVNHYVNYGMSDKQFTEVLYFKGVYYLLDKDGKFLGSGSLTAIDNSILWDESVTISVDGYDTTYTPDDMKLAIEESLEQPDISDNNTSGSGGGTTTAPSDAWSLSADSLTLTNNSESYTLYDASGVEFIIDKSGTVRGTVANNSLGIDRSKDPMDKWLSVGMGDRMFKLSERSSALSSLINLFDKDNSSTLPSSIYYDPVGQKTYKDSEKKEELTELTSFTIKSSGKIEVEYSGSTVKVKAILVDASGSVVSSTTVTGSSSLVAEPVTVEGLFETYIKDLTTAVSELAAISSTSTNDSQMVTFTTNLTNAYVALYNIIMYHDVATEFMKSAEAESGMDEVIAQLDTLITTLQTVKGIEGIDVAETLLVTGTYTKDNFLDLSLELDLIMAEELPMLLYNLLQDEAKVFENDDTSITQQQDPSQLANWGGQIASADSANSSSGSSGTATSLNGDGSVVWFGDELTGAVKSDISSAIPGATVNTSSNKTASEALNELQGMTDIPDTVVLSVGTHGGVDEAEIDAAMEYVATTNPDAKVFWVNTYAQSEDETHWKEINAKLESAKKKNSNLTVIDWYGTATNTAGYDTWYGNSDVLPDEVGQKVFVDFVNKSIGVATAESATSESPTPTPSATDGSQTTSTPQPSAYVPQPAAAPQQASAVAAASASASASPAPSGSPATSTSPSPSAPQSTDGSLTTIADNSTIAEGYSVHDPNVNYKEMYDANPANISKVLDAIDNLANIDVNMEAEITKFNTSDSSTIYSDAGLSAEWLQFFTDNGMTEDEANALTIEEKLDKVIEIEKDTGKPLNELLPGVKYDTVIKQQGGVDEQTQKDFEEELTKATTGATVEESMSLTQYKEILDKTLVGYDLSFNIQSNSQLTLAGSFFDLTTAKLITTGVLYSELKTIKDKEESSASVVGEASDVIEIDVNFLFEQIANVERNADALSTDFGASGWIPTSVDNSFMKKCYYMMVASTAVYRPFQSKVGDSDYLASVINLAGSSQAEVAQELVENVAYYKKPLYYIQTETAMLNDKRNTLKEEKSDSTLSIYGFDGEINGEVKSLNLKDLLDMVDTGTNIEVVMANGALDFKEGSANFVYSHPAVVDGEIVVNSLEEDPVVRSEEMINEDGEVVLVGDVGYTTPVLRVGSASGVYSQTSMLFENITNSLRGIGADEYEEELLFMDAIGNVTLSDGTVILPAVANPSLLNHSSDKTYYNPMTAAFMNSYPQIVESDAGILNLAGLSEKGKYAAFYKSYEKYDASMSAYPSDPNANKQELGEDFAASLTGQPTYSNGSYDMFRMISTNTSQALYDEAVEGMYRIDSGISVNEEVDRGSAEFKIWLNTNGLLTVSEPDYMVEFTNSYDADTPDEVLTGTTASGEEVTINTSTDTDASTNIISETVDEMSELDLGEEMANAGLTLPTQEGKVLGGGSRNIVATNQGRLVYNWICNQNDGDFTYYYDGLFTGIKLPSEVEASALSWYKLDTDITKIDVNSSVGLPLYTDFYARDGQAGSGTSVWNLLDNTEANSFYQDTAKGEIRIPTVSTYSIKFNTEINGVPEVVTRVTSNVDEFASIVAAYPEARVTVFEESAVKMESYIEDEKPLFPYDPNMSMIDNDTGELLSDNFATAKIIGYNMYHYMYMDLTNPLQITDTYGDKMRDDLMYNVALEALQGLDTSRYYTKHSTTDVETSELTQKVQNITNKVFDVADNIRGVLGAQTLDSNKPMSIIVYTLRDMWYVVIILIVILAVFGARGENLIKVVTSTIIAIGIFLVSIFVLPQMFAQVYDFVSNLFVEDVTTDIVMRTLEEVEGSKGPVLDLKDSNSSLTLYEFTEDQLDTYAKQANLQKSSFLFGDVLPLYNGTQSGEYLQGNKLKVSTDLLFDNNPIEGSYIAGEGGDYELKASRFVSDSQIDRYAPYFLIQSNFIDELNQFLDFYTIPRSIISYVNGETKDSYIVYNYVNSIPFLYGDEIYLWDTTTDYGREYISAMGFDWREIEKIQEVFPKSFDFLGIQDIIENIDPNDAKAQTTWYRVMLENGYYDPEFGQARRDTMIEYVNYQTKRYILQNEPMQDNVSDETLIKLISLQATFFFNQAISETSLDVDATTHAYPMAFNNSEFRLSDVLETVLTQNIDVYRYAEFDLVDYTAGRTDFFGSLLLLIVTVLMSVTVAGLNILSLIAFVLFILMLLFNTFKGNNLLDCVMGYIKINAVLFVVYTIFVVAFDVMIFFDFGLIVSMLLLLVLSVVVLITLFHVVRAMMSDPMSLGNNAIGEKGLPRVIVATIEKGSSMLYSGNNGYNASNNYGSAEEFDEDEELSYVKSVAAGMRESDY